MSDTTPAVAAKVTFWQKLGQIFCNKDGQVSSEEILKILAGAAGIALAAVFFFGHIIPIEKASYVMIVEGALWGYALGQGITHNVTNQ